MGRKRFNPKVSIIIPVYNGSNYLRQAIDSALAQTYKNLEIIVVNDGSKDGGKTDFICRSYENRIRYVKKENGGVSSALNSGISIMNGDYFSWLSHDDIYYPDKVEKQIEFLSKIPSRNNIILYSNYDLIDKDGRFIREVIQNHNELSNKPIYALLRGVLNGITLLIPKSAFMKYGQFNEDLKCTQDYDMWMRMGETYTFLHMDTILTRTRIHAHQDSNKHPNVVTEGDKLWISIMESIPQSQRKVLEGTEYNYYREMREFLRTHANIYQGAIKHADKRMLEIIEVEKEKGTTNEVTIIIPFYNRVKPLLRAISSVLQQTYNKWELLLINDGSNINLHEVIDFIKPYENIKIENIKINGGPAKARNIGINKANGEYITFLDSDDEFFPNKIEDQLLEMVLTQAEVSHTSYVREINKEENVVNTGEMSGIVVPRIISSCEIATPTVMIKKSFLDKNKYRFLENLRVGEDTCFWLELLQNTKLLGIDKPLSIIHANPKSSFIDPEKHLEGLTNVLGYLLTNQTYSKFNDNISVLMQRYIEISQQVRYQKRLKNREKDEPIQENKLKKLLYLFKYQGVFLTLKKIIWKYVPRAINKVKRVFNGNR